MNIISERVSRLAASATLMMSQRASEMKAEGIDVINLSIGEPDFPTPSHISEAAKTAIDNGMTHYTPIDGLLQLREAICSKMKRENHVNYSPNQIVVSGGAKQALCNAVLALVNEGDEVLIPTPAWVSYPQMVLLSGGKPITLTTTAENNYKLSPEQLQHAITSKTKLLILCSPSNPTGSVYSKSELQSLAEVLRQHPEVLVISDEIYEHIRYTTEPHYSLAQEEDLRERIIVINGVSKAYAMTGWRIGWLAATEQIAKACKKLQGQYTSCPSSVSQMAAIAALGGSQQCVEDMRRVFEKRRNLVLDLASELADVRFTHPEGAFYLMLDLSAYIGKCFKGKTMENSFALTMYLLEEAHVTLVDGEAFFSPGTVRLSYAASEQEIKEAFRRIKEGLKKLEG